MLVFQPWKVILVLAVVVAGFIFALPNLFPSSALQGVPEWIPHKQVNLGLDLQGGAHLLYQIDEKELVEDWLSNIRGDVRESLRRARIGYTDLLQNDAGKSVSVTIRNAADTEKAFDELKKLSTPVGNT
ncbi:MAG: protein translocase subunit SecDF, partial [Hyphomicrobiales bacterium]